MSDCLSLVISLLTRKVSVSFSVCIALIFLTEIASAEVVSKCQKCPSQSKDYSMGFSSDKAGPATNAGHVDVCYPNTKTFEASSS